MVIENLRILVLWTKIALAFEGLTYTEVSQYLLPGYSYIIVELYSNLVIRQETGSESIYLISHSPDATTTNSRFVRK